MARRSRRMESAGDMGLPDWDPGGKIVASPSPRTGRASAEEFGESPFRHHHRISPVELKHPQNLKHSPGSMKMGDGASLHRPPGPAPAAGRWPCWMGPKPSRRSTRSRFGARFSVSELRGDQPDDRGRFVPFDARPQRADEDRIRAEPHLRRRPGLVLAGSRVAPEAMIERRSGSSTACQKRRIRRAMNALVRVSDEIVMRLFRGSGSMRRCTGHSRTVQSAITTGTSRSDSAPSKTRGPSSILAVEVESISADLLDSRWAVRGSRS